MDGSVGELYAHNVGGLGQVQKTGADITFPPPAVGQIGCKKSTPSVFESEMLADRPKTRLKKTTKTKGEKWQRRPLGTYYQRPVDLPRVNAHTAEAHFAKSLHEGLAIGAADARDQRIVTGALHMLS